MEAITIKRLEAMGNKVREGSDTCKTLVDFSQENMGELNKTQRVAIEKLRVSVERLRGEIQHSMSIYNEFTPELESKIEDLTTLQIEAEDLLVEVDINFSSQRPDNTCGGPFLTTENQSVNTRLPKLEMNKYDGNILRWHEFWDQFSSVIESRTNMSDVDKLSYLNSLVEGDAKRAIEGLDITNSNYRVAVERLTERFGKTGSLIDAHYTALQQIPTSPLDISICRRTLDEIERHLRTLQSLGENTEHKQLRATILEKFPNEIMFDLRMTMTSDNHSVSEIRALLEKVIAAREAAHRMATINTIDKTDTNTHTNPNYTIEALYTSINDLKKQLTSTPSTSGVGRFNWSSQKKSKTKTDNDKLPEKRFKKRGYPMNRENGKRRKLQCIFCMGGHIHENCETYKTTNERKRKLENRCFLCLRVTHFASQCPFKTKIKCPHCDKRGSHNRCLCPTLDKSMTKQETMTNSCLSQIQCDTILQTATVLIQTGMGKSTGYGYRVLFDTGSQKSYVRSDLAKQLKLKVIEPACLTIFTFGSEKPKLITTDIVSLKLQTNEGQLNVQAYTIPTLTGIIPAQYKLRESLKKSHPCIVIADDVSQDCAADIIIGNDYYHSVVKGGRLEVTSTLVLIETSIGWIPSGMYKDNLFQYNILSVLTYFQGIGLDIGVKNYSYPDPAIKDDNIRAIWELETIGIKDSPKVLEDEEVVQFFNDTTVFHNGRYHVKWPWTQYPPELPVNFGLSFGRLKSLMKRSDRDILIKYNDVIQDQLNKGIIEVVTEKQLPKTHPVHYLPHHCVIQPQKTTKLRIVYDGSAKAKGQLSLNEYLYKGPLLLAEMTQLLLRFRQFPVGIVADIEKAFLQIGLQAPDRDVTRFLWVTDIRQEPSEENLLHLRFCRVPFGIISSPFLLAATIRKHLLKNKDSLSNKVAECLYVDNLVTGVNTEDEAKAIFSLTKNCFEELSMNIREWNSNSQSFLNAIPHDAKVEKSVIPVLGLVWDTTQDTISFAIQHHKIERAASTKREILSVIASVFDPCGFSAPLTLPTRLFLQDLWKEKLQWDTPLSQAHADRWENCKTFLRGIPKVSVPRYHFSNLITTPKDWSYELHCFTDASKEAYVAVVYLRASKQNQHLTSLVMSKSRLTPVKRKDSFTIPKLELLAVVIGARLLRYVRNTMEMPIDKSFLWTDSQVVLGWLRSERLLPPFIARRIADIRTVEAVQFRYVRSSLNPADVATRQMDCDSLPKLWIRGPGFLSLSAQNWPINWTLDFQEKVVIPDPQPVIPTTQMVHANTSDYKLPSSGIILPSPQIVDIQTKYYPNEQKGQATPLSKSLGLYIDEYGVLRCKGRFANAPFTTDQKYPILLPKVDPITSAIIQRIHKDHQHVGVLHTLSLLRQTYWVPQGRSLVAKILRQCATCIKYGGGPYQLPGMPDLPAERVTFSAPFTNTGLDYFGPMITVDKGERRKRWACIFTCMAVRAIHIELVDDCSAEEFLLAFRRFSATRGKPKLVVSDNAANFKLVASTLDTSEGKTHSTQWKFIPALSPWFGGFYERLVGLVKNCLRRTLDQSLLTDGQLRTVLYEIAATLNSRPLTAVSSDPEMILTPSHFLSTCGPAVVNLDQPQTIGAVSRVREHLIGSWRRTDALLKQFGVMFQTHYLSSLRERHTLGHKQPRVVSHREPQLGDKVQIRGDSKNRVHWKIGTITSLLASADGATRTARVTLADGSTLTRSVGHLYPLEMDIMDLAPADQVVSGTAPRDCVVSGGSQDKLIQSLPTQDDVPLSNSLRRSLSAPDPPADGLLTLLPPRPSRAAARQAIQRIRAWASALFVAATASLV